jgi:hypothetical protein
MVIRPRIAANNNASSTASIADIDISQGTNIVIGPGIADGYGGGANRMAFGVQLGAGVTGASVNGLTSRRHSTLAANVLNGATNISIVGGDFTGNTADGIQVLGGASSVSINGTLGVQWRSYTPTVACGAGTITTLGAVAGSYQLRGKSLSLSIAIPITTIGTCATSMTVSLPSGLITAAAVSLNGRETAVTGKALAVSAGGSGATVLQVAYYDNSFPGAGGVNLVISGDLQIQ